MKTLEQLQPMIIEWAKERNLININNAYQQAEKTQEELVEMKIHIYMQKHGVTEYNEEGKLINVNEQIKDNIGAQIVTLAIQCAIQGTTLEECLNIAWNEIKDRTENGIF